LAHLHSVCTLIAQVQRLLRVSDIFVDDLVDLHGNSINIGRSTYLLKSDKIPGVVWSEILAFLIFISSPLRAPSRASKIAVMVVTK